VKAMPMNLGRGQLTLTDLNDAIISGTPPANPSVGTLWVDESESPKLLKRWSGTDWIVLGEISDEGTGGIVIDIQETLGNMANDNIIEFNERKVIKDKLNEILGYVIADTATTLPTTATLETNKKGDFYTVRKSAFSAGISTGDATYTAVATKYNALKAYLDAMTPVKPWDISSANEDKLISVTKSSFRTNWLDYYNAVNDLSTLTAEKLKKNVDEIVVGVTNYASNGNFEIDITKARWKDSYAGQTKEVVDISTETPPFKYAFHVKNTTNANGGIFIPTIWDGLIAEALVDKEVTVSFWLKYQNIVQGASAFQLGRFGELVIEGVNASGTKYYSYPRFDSSGNITSSSYISGTNTTWVKYSGTIKLTLPTNAIKLTKISFKHGLESCTGEFWTTGIKVEIGNKATDWSPNPEDIQERLTSAEFLLEDDQIVSKVTTSQTFSTIINDTKEEAKDYSSLYVQSRGENLVTNGTGLLGDNTNFSGFTFDGSQTYAGAGSFYTNAQNSTKFSDELIPVDPSKKYRASIMAKSNLAIGKNYVGFYPYDIDKNVITADQRIASNFPIVSLAQDLKVGDTIVYLTSLDGFTDNQGDNSHYHSFALWGYKNSYGYEYPAGTYSRFVFMYGWLNGAINTTNKTITLSKPFNITNPSDPNGVFRAGHKLSRTHSGGSYLYTVASNVTFPTEWTKYEGILQGVGDGSGNPGKFPHGTGFIKFLFLTNRSTSGGQAGDSFWVNSISLTDITSIDEVKDLATQTQNTVSDMMSDLKVTPLEKNELARLWSRIQQEYTQLNSQATSLSVSSTIRTNYTNAYTALNSTSPRIQTDVLADMTTTYTFSTTTLRDTFKTQMNTYFAKAEEISKAITDVVNSTANTAKTTADELKNTTVPAIATRVGTVEQKVTDGAIVGTVTSSTQWGSKANANDVYTKEELKNMQTAQLIHSTDFEDLSKWTLGTAWSLDASKRLEGLSSMKVNISGQASDVWNTIYSEYVKAGDNEDFVASVYTTTDDLATDTSTRGWVMYLEYHNDTARIGYTEVSIKPSAINTWERFSISGKTLVGTTRVRIRMHPVRNGRFWIAKPMLSRGKVPVAWNPHIDELATDLKSQISQTAGRVDIVVGSDNKIKGEAIASAISVTPSAIDLISNNINLTGKVSFSSMDSTTQNRITTVENNATKALNTQIGGTNLLRDSYMTDWYPFNANATHTKTNLEVGTSNKMTYTTGTTYGLRSPARAFTTRYETDKKYTLSFDVRGNVANMNYTYLMRNDGNNTSFSGSDTAISSVGGLSTTEYKRISLQITSPFTTEQGYVLIGSTDTGSGKWFEIRYPKIEEGEKATSWSANPLDVAVDILDQKALTDYWRVSGKTTINGGVLETGSIGAEKLTIGMNPNIIQGGWDMLDQINDGEVYYIKDATYMATTLIRSDRTALAGKKVYETGSNAGGTPYVYPSSSARFNVEIGKTYIFSAYVQRPFSSYCDVRVGVRCNGTTNSFHYGDTSRVTYGDGYKRIFTKFTVPSTATSLTADIILRDDSGGKTLWWDAFMVEECSVNQTEPSPWKPAGTTIINGGSIITDTIEAKHIKSLNGLNVGSGQFVVDSSGNVTFAGKLQGASIESNSTINVTTDLTVGGYIYIGKGVSTALPRTLVFGTSLEHLNSPSITGYLGSDTLPEKLYYSADEHVFSGDMIEFDRSDFILSNMNQPGNLDIQFANLTVNGNRVVTKDSTGVIKLESNSAIDTAGSAVRWKYDNTNYIYQSANGIDFYQGNGILFTMIPRDTTRHSFLHNGNLGLKFLSGATKRIQARDSADLNYVELQASNVSVSSRRKFKKEIRKFDDYALNYISKHPIYTYLMKEDGVEDNRKMGLVYEDAPELLRNDDETLSLYNMIALLWKGVQELSDELDYYKKKR
jgi:hypothetical protein